MRKYLTNSTCLRSATYCQCCGKSPTLTQHHNPANPFQPSVAFFYRNESFNLDCKFKWLVSLWNAILCWNGLTLFPPMYFYLVIAYGEGCYFFRIEKCCWLETWWLKKTSTKAKNILNTTILYINSISNTILPYFKYHF